MKCVRTSALCSDQLLDQRLVDLADVRLSWVAKGMDLVQLLQLIQNEAELLVIEIELYCKLPKSTRRAAQLFAKPTRWINVKSAIGWPTAVLCGMIKCSGSALLANGFSKN